jgi:hypothetical protein
MLVLIANRPLCLSPYFLIGALGKSGLSIGPYVGEIALRVLEISTVTYHGTAL